MARTAGSVAVFGHSYGANCAMGSAALTPSVTQLMLDEPTLGAGYQGHMAHKTGPILVVDLIRTFVSTGSDSAATASTTAATSSDSRSRA